MEIIKKFTSKAFATLAIIGVFVAVCTDDDSANETIMRGCGLAAFVIGLVGWSLTSKDKEVEL